jgi:hypothetical protein
MDDNLISKPESNEGGNKAPSDEKASDERTQNPDQNVGSGNRNVVVEPKSSLVFNAVLFAIIEAIAFILWQFADGLTGYICVFVHWLSLIFISAGPIPATLEVLKREWWRWFWAICAFVWLLLAANAYIVWRPLAESKPSLNLVLNTSISPTNLLYLTNDFLISRGRVAVLGWLTSSSEFLYIPVSKGESNVLLKFGIVNDSGEEVDNPEVHIILPEDVNIYWDEVWLKSSFGTEGRLQLINSPCPFLSSTDGHSLPDIGFNPTTLSTKGFGSIIPISVLIEAKNVSPFLVSFWLVAAPPGDQKIFNPVIISGKNAIFDISTNGTNVNLTMKLKWR